MKMFTMVAGAVFMVVWSCAQAVTIRGTNYAVDTYHEGHDHIDMHDSNLEYKVHFAQRAHELIDLCAILDQGVNPVLCDPGVNPYYGFIRCEGVSDSTIACVSVRVYKDRPIEPAIIVKMIMSRTDVVQHTGCTSLAWKIPAEDKDLVRACKRIKGVSSQTVSDEAGFIFFSVDIKKKMKRRCTLL